MIKFWRRSLVKALEKEFVVLGDIVDEKVLDFYYGLDAFFDERKLKDIAVYSLRMIRRAWNMDYQYRDSYLFFEKRSPDYFKLEERAALLYRLAMNRLNTS